VVDLETKTVKWFNFLQKDQQLHGDYELLRVYRDTLIVRFSAADTPTQIYAVTIKEEKKDVDELIGIDNIKVKLIEQVKIGGDLGGEIE